MCEHCEWENAVNVDALLEKWTDALTCADSWEEKNLISEFIEDLKDVKRV